MADLKLYYSEGSPFARKVRIVLEELGVEFESDVLNALRPVADIEARNPALSIPVLEHGDLTLFESDLIVEYALENFGSNSPGTESTPFMRSMWRASHRWADGKCLSVSESLGSSIVNTALMTRYGGVSVDGSDYLQRQQRRIETCLDWLEAAATRDGFVPGWFTMMDISFICHIGYGEARDVVTLGNRPTLAALREKFSSRPSVRHTEIPST